MQRCVMLICLVATDLVLPQLAASAEAVQTPPNIVLVMTDDQGYGDVGIHGNDVIRTPNLDRFAQDGVQFRRFYCSPVCAPTRASLLSGQYYYRTGVIHTSRGGAKMAGTTRTIAEQLTDQGYVTGIFGKWHLGDTYPMRPDDQGFQHSLIHKSGGIGQTPDLPNSYFDPLLWRNRHRFQGSGYCTDIFFDAAIHFIQQYREQPFFVYLAANAPHTPLEVADSAVRPYRELGLDETTARVYAMVENIDNNLGRLLQALDQLQLRNNTLVIFLTDNGPQQPRYNAGLRGRKSWTYEGGIRVPCFVQWPDRIPGGRLIDSVAAHIDLVPTLLQAAGGELPNDLDGRSLLPQLTDPAALAGTERQLFFQCHRGLTPQLFQNCAVVTQQFKMVGYPGTFSDEDLQTSTTEPVLELYDLLSDPDETQDLADSHPAVLQQLRTAYEAWFADVRATRQFQPGIISVGSAAEAATVLCRYQDGTFQDGVSQGWSVRVLEPGRYRVSVNRGELTGAVDLHVSWQGDRFAVPVAADSSSAAINLAAGEGMLDIWLQRPGQDRERPGDKSLTGDVTLTRIAEP